MPTTGTRKQVLAVQKQRKKTVFFSQNNQKNLQTPGAPTPEPAAGKPARNKEQNSLGRSAGGLCL